MAQAQDKTPVLWKSGNAFLSECGDMTQKTSATFVQGVCVGYVEGVREGFQMAYPVQNLNPPYCIPAEATVGQLASILIKFIKDHPEKSHLETRMLEIESLTDAFPCKAAAKKK